MQNGRFIDKSTERKEQIVRERLQFFSGVPMFSIIEFNIAGNCNRSCNFCPVSDPTLYTRTKESLSLELFEKIVEDLSSIGYRGKILFSAFSEPLLHKKIETLIATAKQKLPAVRVEIVSNGDLLTGKKLKKLYEAGLDTVNISMYDGKHQIEQFETMRIAEKLPESFMVLRRRYYEDGNFGITISNRAGLVDSNEYRDAKEASIVELPLKEQCFYPFYMILVDYNGDVLLCPHDWSKKLTLGNVGQEHIWDIWQGKRLMGIRSKLAASNRNFEPCHKCDVLGTVIGSDSFKAWMESGA